MNQALSILEELQAHLQEIQQALGDRWPDFARRMRELAKLFEDSPDEAALDEAINQLYGLFMEDELVCEIVTRPGSDEAIRSSRPAAQNLSTEDIASRFYLLCQQADRLVQRLRLDMAAPDQVNLGQPFVLVAAVRLPSSPVLNEDDLARTKSGNVQVVWPESAPYVRLAVQVIAPACQIHDSDSAQFLLHAGQDSPVFYFWLTPQQPGAISLVVKIYQEDDWLGSARIRTVCGQVAGKLQVAQNLSASPGEQIDWMSYRTHLRQTLEAHFDESELRTLCFDLGLEYADLPHATRAEATMGLVGYLERRGRIPELIEMGKHLRPAVAWGKIPPSMCAV